MSVQRCAHRRRNDSSLIFHPESRLLATLGLEGAPAAAGLHGVRIVELEAAGFEAFIEVDCRAIEIQGALLIDDDGYSVVFVLCIDLFVVGFIKAESIGESTAAAAGYADAE